MKLTRLQESRIKRNLNQSSNFTTDRTEIEKILEEDFHIGNYTINSDGTVDVKGNVSVHDKLKKYGGRFPIRFGEVTGNFECHYNDLVSLEGAPHTVDGDFRCNNNKLTTLEGAPKEVGGDFNCTNNKLTSLEGAPSEVGGYFWCTYNKLTSLEGAPQKVGGEFNCDHNKLTSLEGAPQGIKLSAKFNPITAITANSQHNFWIIYWERSEAIKIGLFVAPSSMDAKLKKWNGVDELQRYPDGITLLGMYTAEDLTYDYNRNKLKSKDTKSIKLDSIDEAEDFGFYDTIDNYQKYFVEGNSKLGDNIEDAGANVVDE